MSESLYVLGPDRKPVPDPQLLGPLLFAALRALSREQGQPVTRAWREEARHTLLYVSQNCSSLRTSLVREDFTGIQLGVELTLLVSKLTGLRDAVCPAARERTPSGHADGDKVRDRRGKEWGYSEPGDVWKLLLDDGCVSHTSSRSWHRLLADYGPLAREETHDRP